MLRAVGGVSALGLLGYFAFGDAGAYSRTVDRPPAEVAAALADLDIRDAPGAPGTDARRSGGQLPTFTVATSAGQVEWVVNAHGQVATRMIAHLEPLDGGRRTRVTASVKRGPAPDDLVSPAFRSSGVTMGLFSMMLEEELDELVFKIGPWGPHCDAVMARFEQRNLANVDQHDPRSLGQAMAGTAKAAMSIAALDKELKAAGCPMNAGGDKPGPDGFVPVRAMMKDNGPDIPAPAVRDATRPTTDLSDYR